MKWEPHDIIRLVALVGGFFLCALGAYLMWLGVGAEGSVDIKSSLISGTVKTGSAGLFIIFFGAAIVLFVLATLSANGRESARSQSEVSSRVRTVGMAFAALLAATISCGALAALGYGDGFGFMAAFIGMVMVFAGAAYLEISSN